jgi:hypothetical protein
MFFYSSFLLYSGGWLVAAEVKSRDTESLVDLLRPENDLFRLLLSRSDEMSFAFPLDKLPLHVRTALLASPRRADAVPAFLLRRPVTAGSSITLNAFEYFLFCVAYFAVSTRPSSLRPTAGASVNEPRPSDTVIGNFVQRLDNVLDQYVLTSGGPVPSATPAPRQRLFDRVFIKFVDFVFGNMREPVMSSGSNDATSGASGVGDKSGSSAAAAVALAVGDNSSRLRNKRDAARWQHYEYYNRANSKPDAPLRVLFLDIMLLFWTQQNSVALSDVRSTLARVAAEQLPPSGLPPRRALIRYADTAGFVTPTRLVLEGLTTIVSYVVDEVARLASLQHTQQQQQQQSPQSTPQPTPPQSAPQAGAATGALDLTPLRRFGLAQMQRPLFHFFHQCFWYWSNQSSQTDAKFTKMLSLWVAFVRPWKSKYYQRPPHVTAWAEAATETTETSPRRSKSSPSKSSAAASRDGDDDGEQSDNSAVERADIRYWHEYVVSNLAFYTSLGRDVMIAALDFDYMARATIDACWRAFCAQCVSAACSTRCDASRWRCSSRRSRSRRPRPTCGSPRRI